MTLLPGLTSTRKERIPAFLEDLRRSGVRLIALFPTCLSAAERNALYRELERIEGLRVPHVHLRSDCAEAEIEYLAGRFGTEAFNIHPRASTHPFPAVPPRFAPLFFVENTDVPAEEADLDGSAGPALGGLCPDYSHLENARAFGRASYVQAAERLLSAFPVGCCHLSAVRVGDPNQWNGEWDHHDFVSLSDFDYLSAYRRFLPEKWASLELENPLSEQLEAAAYLERLLGAAAARPAQRDAENRVRGCSASKPSARLFRD